MPAKKKAPEKKSEPGAELSSGMRSIRRCFAIMELFDQERRPMKASEIARELDAPLSSVIDLLKCVSSLGYFAYDSRTRSYFTTTRLGLLGGWLTASPLDQSNYIDLMEELHRQTQETIGAFWQNDLEMKCVAAIPGTHPISFLLAPGTSFPLFGSAVGTALLAKWSDDDIKSTIQRVKRQKSANFTMSQESVMRAVQKARSRGFAAGYDLVIQEVGAITGASPVAGNRWIVFSVGGLSKRIKQQERELSKILVDTLSGQTKKTSRQSA